MERTLRRRNLMRKRIMRLLVIALIYSGLLATTVGVCLGGIWILKNTIYGWCMLLIVCLITGGWLFFRIGEEGQTAASVTC